MTQATVRRNWQQLAKRFFDIGAASIALVVLSPLLLFTALLILMTEGRPIFYRSRRYVAADRAITVTKFRTMVRDATSPKYDLNGRFMRDGYLDIPLDCEVYTKVGRVLERYQIVEVLQLWNIIAHGMSLIGNRPLPGQNIQLLSARFPEFEERFMSPAGLTGISQVIGKFNLTPEMRLRLESAYSRVYQRGNILRCDLFILLYTLRFLVRADATPREIAFNMLRRCASPADAQLMRIPDELQVDFKERQEAHVRVGSTIEEGTFNSTQTYEYPE